MYIGCDCVLTPEGHEDGEEDGSWVVEQVAGSGRTTRRPQLPVAAGTVAEWTHGDVVPGITNLHTDKTGMDGGCIIQRIVQRNQNNSSFLLVIKCGQ